MAKAMAKESVKAGWRMAGVASVAAAGNGININHENMKSVSSA
jgi:hypothetical protein